MTGREKIEDGEQEIWRAHNPGRKYKQDRDGEWANTKDIDRKIEPAHEQQTPAKSNEVKWVIASAGCQRLMHQARHTMTHPQTEVSGNRPCPPQAREQARVIENDRFESESNRRKQKRAPLKANRKAKCACASKKQATMRKKEHIGTTLSG